MGRTDQDTGKGPGIPGSDELEDEVAQAVERSYATRLTSGTDLSQAEKASIEKKVEAGGKRLGTDGPGGGQ
jgi:hypothetical protein